MRLVRTGICRDVLLVGRWAVKVPTWRYGLYSWTRGVQANLSEREWCGYSGSMTRRGRFTGPRRTSEPVGLAPVLRSWLGGIVQVYPRCLPVPADAEIDYETIAPFMPSGDRKTDNVGLLDGRLVWIDYDYSWNGCPHARSLDEPRRLDGGWHAFGGVR